MNINSQELQFSTQIKKLNIEGKSLLINYSTVKYWGFTGTGDALYLVVICVSCIFCMCFIIQNIIYTPKLPLK